MPLKSPNIIETIIMIPDIVKIEESNAIRRKCDQPGVVGENDSCNKIKRRFQSHFLVNKFNKHMC